MNNSYCFKANDVIDEQNFFAKALPSEDIEKRKMLEDAGIFKKETKFYGNFLPKLIKYSGNLIHVITSQQNQYFPSLLSHHHCRLQVHQNGHRPVIFHVTICLSWKT